MECEIVDSMAMGKAFKYCRTHKCESHECNKASRSETLAKSEKLKVGDRLVVLVDYPGHAALIKADVVIVESICSSYWNTIRVKDRYGAYWDLDVNGLNKDYAVVTNTA